MSALQALYDNSPTLSHLFPEWLTTHPSTPFDERTKIYRDMVKFLKHKGIVKGEVPHGLFEMMQAYLQDGTPLYYEDPLRRFVLWVGIGEPDENSRMFFRK